MRFDYRYALSAAALLLAPGVLAAQNAEGPSRSIAGGGINAPGWTGKVDASEAKQGMTVNNAKFSKEGGEFRVTTGPATSYWNPANTASGDYTVKATFTEPKYMNLNTHPHPYGVFIAGTNLGTDNENYLYCAAYGNGMFIVRGFGPAPFQMNGRRGEANDAVHKAAAVGQPVTQEIALSVSGGHIKCAINGTVVADYEKSAAVGPGKLAGTDGVYGLRFAHNTEVVVTNFGVSKK